MKEMLVSSTFFGVMISLLAYQIGVVIKKKTKLGIANPLLISIILVILFLVVFKIDYSDYNDGAKYLSYFLTPATVCLAIPLYENFHILKSNWKAIMAGILSGAFASMGSVLLLALVFGLTHEQYVTLLPKSITTAIGMDVSEELGGIVNITVAVIIITGIIGNVIGEAIFKLFKITEPAARGIGLGSSAHAIGTAKAFELGEVEGAMSSLSIAISGLITVIFASIFAGLM